MRQITTNADADQHCLLREKHRNPALEAAEQEYIKRLSRQARVALCPQKGKAQGGLPDRLLKGKYVVGLYVEGEPFTSEQLAQRFQRLMNQGRSHLVLVIGGAEGMPAGVESQIQEQWSLSPLTFSPPASAPAVVGGFVSVL